MRGLGDDYVKAGTSTLLALALAPFFLNFLPRRAEFRRHQKIDTPVWIIGFLSQWKMYLDSLPDGSGGDAFRGKRLDTTVFEKVHIHSSHACRASEMQYQLSSEQLGQLYELMHATKDAWKTVDELAQGDGKVGEMPDSS
jgi:hypothetical protein